MVYGCLPSLLFSFLFLRKLINKNQLLLTWQFLLENNPEIPPSSREEGLRLLHGHESALVLFSFAVKLLRGRLESIHKWREGQRGKEGDRGATVMTCSADKCPLPCWGTQG